MPEPSEDVGVNDWQSLLHSLGLLLTSYLAAAWAAAYPVITALAGIAAAILALHGLARLVIRWAHGENTLTGK